MLCYLHMFNNMMEYVSFPNVPNAVLDDNSGYCVMFGNISQ